MNYWQHCLRHLETKLSEEQFNTWIQPLRCNDGCNSKEIILYTPNSFIFDWVEHHYLNLIEEFMLELSGDSEPKIFLEHDSLFTPEKIDSCFDFDSFLEEKSNQLAIVAGISVAEKPGSSFNPLFIYGGEGSGKTHLLHAIGNLAIEQDHDRNVTYMSSYGFFMGMIEAIKLGAIDQFRRNMSAIDVLLIDDMQFFSGKGRSQIELIYIVNLFSAAEKQIVLTSESSPDEMDIDNRLKSLFGSGLVVPIGLPDFNA